MDDAQNANIDIVFAAGDHDDGEPFDGKGLRETQLDHVGRFAGNILAHAFFPRYGGDVHFDEDEKWSPNKTRKIWLHGALEMERIQMVLTCMPSLLMKLAIHLV